MASLNKVTLIGNVGAAPEIRVLPSASKAAAFSLASTDRWRDRETGENKEHTEWHRLIAYEGLALLVENHVKKGALLYVEGKLRTRKWTDSQQIERYSTEIVLDSLQFLGPKRSDAGQEQAHEPQESTPAPTRASAHSRPRENPE